MPVEVLLRLLVVLLFLIVLTLLSRLTSVPLRRIVFCALILTVFVLSGDQDVMGIAAHVGN